LFKAIYRMLPEDKRPKFESVELKLSARDRLVTIEELGLGSPLLTLQGTGTATMDGYLDLHLEFPNLFGAASEVLIFPEILRRMLTAAVAPALYGCLRDPHARQRTLLSGDPERRPLEPIPARLPARPSKKF